MTKYDEKCIEFLKTEDVSEFLNLPDLIDLLGVEETYKIMKLFGGTYVYIPNTKSIYIKSIHNMICEDINKGLSANNIAKKYGVSVRTIYKIKAEANK